MIIKDLTFLVWLSRVLKEGESGQVVFKLLLVKEH